MGLKLQKHGPTENGGASLGQTWHEIIHRYLLNESRNEYEKVVAAAVINALKVYKSTSSMVKNIEILQSKFPLYGFMTDKENLEINFWNGDADAIGWFEGHYVIVEWKVVNLLEFWDDALAYGDYLHQCLVYARLLQLHLELEKLPYILIVPIYSETGNDIHPALFRDFPKECKEKIEHYEWSKEIKIFEIDVAKTLVDEESFTVPNDGIVPDEARVIDVFKEDVTVRELLEALRLNLSKLKVA